ncbi:MAG: hypothetical protein KAJ18_09875 [Candidatus Omnitrophica bacterium]|nr:hypothetical protein [Candidatus Omnitrophota bacterium]
MGKIDFYAILGLFAGVGGFFWGFMRLRRKRLIENIPTSKIQSLAMGLVELTGKAKSKNPFKSPFQSVDCVYYRYTVEKYVRRNKSSHWVTVAKGDSNHSPFILDDETGEVMVFPKHAELMIPKSYQFQTGWGRGIPSNVEAFLQRNSIRYKGLFGNHTLRFTEWIIVNHGQAYILGTATPAREQIRAHKEKLMERLRILKANPNRMKEIDLNQDGEISEEEWALAVAHEEEKLIEDELSKESDTAIQAVIKRGEGEKIFIISSQSQKDLLGKLAMESGLGIYGGAALAVACAFYLIAHRFPTWF